MASASNQFSAQVYLFALYRCQELYVRAHMKGEGASREQDALLTDMYYLTQRIPEVIGAVPEGTEKTLFQSWVTRIRNRLQPLYDAYGDLNIILGVPFNELPEFPAGDAERLAAAVIRSLRQPPPEFLSSYNQFVTGIEFPREVLVSEQEMQALVRKHHRVQSPTGPRRPAPKEPEMGLNNLNSMFGGNQTPKRQSMEDVDIPASIEKAANKINEQSAHESETATEQAAASVSKDATEIVTPATDAQTVEDEAVTDQPSSETIDAKAPSADVVAGVEVEVQADAEAPAATPSTTQDTVAVDNSNTVEVCVEGGSDVEQDGSNDASLEVEGEIMLEGPTLDEKLDFYLDQQNEAFIELIERLDDTSIEPTRDEITNAAKVMKRFAWIMRDIASDKDALKEAPFRTTHLNVFNELFDGFERIETNQSTNPRGLWVDFKYQMQQAHRLEERYGRYLNPERFAGLLDVEFNAKENDLRSEPATSLVAHKSDALTATAHTTKQVEVEDRKPLVATKSVTPQAEKPVKDAPSQVTEAKAPDQQGAKNTEAAESSGDIAPVSNVAEKIRALLEAYPSPDGDESFKSIYGTDLSKIVKSISTKGGQVDLHLGGQKFMASKVSDKGNSLQHKGILRPAHIEMMAEQARRKGWTKVSLGGRVVRKRGEAWAQLKALGIEVVGHTPSVQDKARLNELLKKAEVQNEVGLSMSVG